MQTLIDDSGPLPQTPAGIIFIVQSVLTISETLTPY